MTHSKDNESEKTIPAQLVADTALRKIISTIKNELNPTHIYFYGSRAHQTHKEHSDYDFVVVIKDSELPRYQRPEKLKKVLSNMGFLTDIFVYTQKEFDDWKDEFSSTPETAMNTGYEVSHL